MVFLSPARILDPERWLTLPEEIPEEVPEELRSLAVFVDGPDFSHLAWPREDAMAVIESLKSTTVAISGGDVIRSEAWGFVPAGDYWLCDRIQGEDRFSYARRSHDRALGYIEDYEEGPTANLLFALTFDTQQHAA